jgi:hypothetical protein
MGAGPTTRSQGRPGVKENDPEPCLEFFFEGPQGAAQLLGSLQRCTIASLWIQAQANIREPETYCPCVFTAFLIIWPWSTICIRSHMRCFHTTIFYCKDLIKLPTHSPLQLARYQKTTAAFDSPERGLDRPISACSDDDT